MVGFAVPVRDPPSWLGVRCWCVTRLHGWACGAGVCPALIVGRAVSLLGSSLCSGLGASETSTSRWRRSAFPVLPGAALLGATSQV